MFMAEYKLKYQNNLYYTDTDSAVINRPLAPELVGNALGQFKLECEIDTGIFIAPKVYGFKTVEGKETIKIKGLSKEAVDGVTLTDLLKLLVDKYQMVLTQDKWHKNLFDGNISVVSTAYKLVATSNKRSPLVMERSNNGEMSEVFVSTSPYNYSDIEVK